MGGPGGGRVPGGGPPVDVVLEVDVEVARTADELGGSNDARVLGSGKGLDLP